MLLPASSPLHSLQTLPLQQQRLQMSIPEVLGSSAGTVMTGYLAGAAAGPAIASFAATARGIKGGSRSWTELRTSVGLAFAFSMLTAAFASAAFNLGSTAVSLAPPLVQVPLLLFMLAIVGGLVPVTALVTGTMASPAVPFRDKNELDEYQEMQASYRSDAWQPPRLWRGAADSPAGAAADERAPEPAERK